MRKDSPYTPTRRELMDTLYIRFVNETMAEMIVENGYPRGSFILRRARNEFIGIKNRSGAIQEEKFSTKMGCLDWLSGLKSGDEIRKREEDERRKFAYGMLE